MCFDVIVFNEYSYLCHIIETKVIFIMSSTYRLFFSWQSDRKDTKTMIFNALNRAKQEFAKNGIILEIDQDTRNRTGKRKIEDEVIYKIEHCDIFVADLTPVTTVHFLPQEHKLPKHMPNSNVMFEYGYAQKCKGENRMIILASLDVSNDEHIEYMPFDINHDTITVFESADDLKQITKWISNILPDVEKERSLFVPKFSCDVITEDGKEITISPTYLRTQYYIDNQPEKEYVPHLVRTRFGLMDFNAPLTPSSDTTLHKSFENIPFKVYNQGTASLDNCKLRITADKTGIQYRDDLEETTYTRLYSLQPDSLIIDEDGAYQYIGTINPGDSYYLSDLYVYAPHDIIKFKLLWELSTRQKKFKGEIVVKVNPQYHDETKASKESDETKIGEWIVDAYSGETQ